MRLGLYVIALLILLTTAARADPTPTLRKWREFVYGKVAYDGVEYFNFDVTEEAFRVILTVDLGDVGDMVGPTMLIKYGSFPTTSDFDQRVYLNASTTFYSVQVDNLRVGRYFITLVGSLLYGSIQDFVGHQSPLFFFLNAYYFGCSDPTRTGAKCVIPLLMADPPVTPTTLSVASNYASNTTNTGCLDTTNRVLYYVVEIPAPEWDLVLTLITSSSLDMTISAGANIRDPASFNTENLSQSVTAKGGDQEHSVDLQVLAPLAGAWMVMVSGGIPTGASCKQGSGVTFQFIAKHTRDCSHTDGAVLPSPDTNLSPLNLCDVSFTPLSEIRYEPFKDDGVVLTTDFKADEPITGGGDGESTVATTQPVTGYTVHVPKIYAGANLIVEALVTANVQSFQVYARVNGLPTPSVFDYHFNSSNASTPTQANDTSSDSTFDVLQYIWNPVVFPKTGQWNMIVIADGALALLPHQTETKNSSFWAIDLSLHTYACPADKACSGHGDCELAETYQGLHYGACSCHYGFGGEQCDTLSLDPSFRTHQILMLLLSNAAIIPVVIVCCRRKLYLESVLFFMAGLTSAVYHACDVELKCFFPYKFLQEMDFALAFNMIMMLTVHFSGARKQAKAGIEICLLILTIVLASNKTTSMANWVFIGMFCVLQFSVTLVYYFVLGSQRMGLGKITALRAFLFQSNNFDPRYGIVGLVLWIVALSCWFTSSATNYWLVHSIWHMGAMLAAACLIGFRRNDRYQMLTPVTGVDVLGPNYNETKPTTIGLKQMTDSKVITVSSENETSSAEPTVAEEA